MQIGILLGWFFAPLPGPEKPIEIAMGLETVISVALIVIGSRADLAYAIMLLGFAGAYAFLVDPPASAITVLVHVVLATYWAHRSTYRYD